MNPITCPRCGRETTEGALNETHWASSDVIAELRAGKRDWKSDQGACAACVQEALLRILQKQGEESFAEGVQSVWPLDAEAAFGAIPTPLRMRSDPRFTGRGVVIALLDSGFYPHPDLTEPVNRIKAWVDAGSEPIEAMGFTHDERPQWPGCDAGESHQWHGLMTSTTAAGNGYLSHGLYCSMASEADLVLIQVREPDGPISNASIERGLRWLVEHGRELGVRVVSISVAGDPVEPLAGNPVDAAIAELVEQGMVVLAAAGNSGQRSLVPPATAPDALTIGGIDDQNTLSPDDVALWHSNYGLSGEGAIKPELVAPSIWVVSPLLPETETARKAAALFERRAAGDESVEAEIDGLKLVTPHYQHVDGTSFATPIVASSVACLLQANPKLSPEAVRDILQATAETLPGIPIERQGHGILDVSQAIALAVHMRRGARIDWERSPQLLPDGVLYILEDDDAGQVEVLGSWDGWKTPGLLATETAEGRWVVVQDLLPAGQYSYKFLVDGHRWLPDPANRRRAADGAGGSNSVLIVPEAAG
jgi:serine protease AprX